MKAVEFLSEFRKTQDVFDWQYVGNSQIRGFLKSGGTGEAFGPISATLFVNNHSDCHGSDSGEALGLSLTDIEAINDAANGNVWKAVDGEMALDGYAAWLREEMAAIVDLEPAAVPQPSPTPVTVNPEIRTEPVIEAETQEV